MKNYARKAELWLSTFMQGGESALHAFEQLKGIMSCEKSGNKEPVELPGEDEVQRILSQAQTKRRRRIDALQSCGYHVNVN
jgi:hypothetical protein